MSISLLETEWWQVALPPEWWAEQEDDTVLIGDRDDVGVIQLSTLRGDGPQWTPDALLEIAREQAEQALPWQAASLGDFNGWYAQWQLEGDALREWYVACEQTLLFITYSCDQDHAGLDDAAVDALLDTLCRTSP